MNKVEKLLEELCPDGVEYYSLQEVFDFKNGYTPSKKKSEYWEGGTIPWVRMDDIRESRLITDTKQHVTERGIKGGLFPVGTLLMSFIATVGEHALLNVEGICNQQIVALMAKRKYHERINPKYVFYYGYKLGEECKRKATKGGGMPLISVSTIKSFKIPLPPLKIQNEIVRILDKITELSAELSAELTLRREQYEYYRHNILSFVEKEGLVSKLHLSA